MNTNKKQILFLSFFLNLCAFAVIIAIYSPIWYTNDDMRMSVIVSGAYSGTPSADIVFMRYPVGILLSFLYSVTATIPWYG